MNKESEKEISLEQFKQVVRDYSKYFFSRWPKIAVVAVVAGILGVTYAWLQKPVYIAELTFATEGERSSSLSGYAGIAAQFGLDLGNGNSGVFEGENLIELMHSRMLIEKTLLTLVEIDGKKELLITYYIRKNKYDVKWSRNPELSKVRFKSFVDPPNRIRDSILKSFSNELSKKSLSIGKVDKKLNFVTARMQDKDEVFAKTFIEQLVNNVIQYYVDYKSKKSRQNVEILKRQTDSVRNMLSGNIVEIAVSNDLNVNPLRQVMRTNVQRRQVDVQVNSALYGELVKNLELSRIALRKETPLIQVIDTPRFPLEKKKLGMLTAGVMFSLVGGLLAFVFFFFKKLLQL